MMKITNKVIGSLDRCYSLALLDYHGTRHLLVAAEKHDNCEMFTLDGKKEDVIWNGPGGVMTMAQVPNTDGVFLANWEFYSPNDSAKARIIIAAPDAGGWSFRTLTDLPFVHRFGILHGSDGDYLIACSLKSAHAFKDDWTCPGRVWGGRLPTDLSGFDSEHQLPLEPLLSGLGHNHGFCLIDNGRAALVGCDEGVYRVAAPANGQPWQIRHLFDQPTSDMLLLDLDGDGERELVTMAPFHGDALTVWHADGEGWRRVFVAPRALPFLHAVWGGTLAGRETAVIGYREGDRELLALRCENGAYHLTPIDQGAGPANVLHYQLDGVDIIAAANRETSEIALYSIES